MEMKVIKVLNEGYYVGYDIALIINDNDKQSIKKYIKSLRNVNNKPIIIINNLLLPSDYSLINLIHINMILMI